jgi:hypothetical protein
MIQYFPIVTGSLTVLGNINVSGSITTSGSITISGSITSASFASTASFVANAESASYVLTAQTASFVANAQTASYVLNAVSSSFASTASFVALAQSASNAVSAATASFANNLTVAGTLTAQTLVVSTINVTQSFSSGSNIFGNASSNTQTFTGSILASGSAFFGGNVLIGSTSPTGTEKFGVTRDDGVTDGLHIIADFNRSGSLSAELILGYYASGSAVTGPVVYAANSQPLLFGAGSVERMRLDANGNLLLTAISPKNPDAYDSNRTFLTVQAKTGGSDRGAFMTLVGTAGGSPNYWIGRYAFASTTATYNHASIISFTDSGGAYSGNLIFTTNANASTGDATERMRITSAGQIGVNTSSPVSTSLTGSITIYKSYNADQASVPSTTAQTYYGNQHGLYLFGRNSGLSIISAHNEEGSIKFGNASTAAYATIGTATGASAVGGDMYFKVGSDTERMRITSGGFVGIGFTPTTQFQVRKNFWQFWVEKTHGSNVNLFSLTIPDFGGAVVTIAGSRYSPGADNYQMTATFYIYVTNGGAVSVNGGNTSGTWTPTTSVSSKTITFSSAYAGSGTNYTGVSVVIQASGHSGGSESAASVALL